LCGARMVGAVFQLGDGIVLDAHGTFK